MERSWTERVDAFIRAVAAMRATQRLYYRHREAEYLVKAKGYERDVDAMLKDLYPAGYFGPDEPHLFT